MPSPAFCTQNVEGQYFGGGGGGREVRRGGMGRGISKETLEKTQQGNNPEAEQVKIFTVSVYTMEFIQSTGRKLPGK